MRSVIAGLVAVIVLCGSAQAADAPTLSDGQKVELMRAVRDAQVTVLQAQLAGARLDALRAMLARPGFDLDLETGVYRPVATQDTGK